MMKRHYQKYLNLIIVSVLALVFFGATASFNYLSQDKGYVKWTSPDEAANYFFSERFSATGQLAFFDRANLIGDQMVLPRSFRSDAGWLKPVSFLGIILIYGTLASGLGAGLIPFFTPLFAAFGIILFYLLIKKIFHDRLALWAAFLLATFPVYIYYTVRSLFHNVLFIVLLLAGAYFLAIILRRKSIPDQAAPKEDSAHKFFTWRYPLIAWGRLLSALLAGLFCGLAIITRTSELLWLVPAGLIILIFYARRLSSAQVVLFFSGLFLALLPAAYENKILYGAYLRGGYNEMNRSLTEISQVGGSFLQATFRGQFYQYRDYLFDLGQKIFYFGFHPQQSLAMFRHYVLEMFPVVWYAGVLGLGLLFIQNCRRFQKKYLVYVLSWLAVSLILVFYYGSWRFNDNPDPTRFTIGNSYTRYWLPLYLGLLPLVSLAIIRFSRALSAALIQCHERLKEIVATGLQAVIVFLIAAASVLFVLYGSEEGLVYLYYNNQAERQSVGQVFSLTAPDSVIITRYYDKLLFPERRVIVGTIPDEAVLKAAAKLVSYYPVYYYNFYLSPADVQYLNERKLPAYQLQLAVVKQINGSFALYQITSYGQK